MSSGHGTLLLRRPLPPVRTTHSCRTAADHDESVCSPQTRDVVGPITLPRITRGFSHHPQRAALAEPRRQELFCLNDFLQDGSAHGSLLVLRRAVLSRQNYRKLLQVFLSELHGGGQSAVANQMLSCDGLPSITHRIPQRQIICELAAAVQAEAEARVSLRSLSGVCGSEDQPLERRSTHSGHEPHTAHEVLLNTVPSKHFQGSRRSGSPFRISAESDVISASELAVLDCVTRGGTRLSLKAHFISEPPDVSCLSDRLQYLNVSFNRLTHVPPQVCGLHQLQVLKMRSNPIEELSVHIGRLHNLQTLVLSFCKITRLPAELFSLSCLQYLDVSYNLLTSLSSDIRLLRCLRSLNVEGNQLVALPAGLLCVSVSELRLSGNYTHALLWSENSRNSAQTLLHTAAHTLAQQRHTHLPPAAHTALCSAGVCDVCSGPVFGPGLKVIRPVGGVFGLRSVPVMFRCCSPACLSRFRNQSDDNITEASGV